MIIRELRLENFGIYGGQHSFDLRPRPAGQFNRPIVLLSGRNGVGKTTFAEAIRLCLHGSVALGSRVGQQEYETYLRNRIHRPLDGVPRPDEAMVQLDFVYVSEAQEREYRVRRSWRRLRASVQEEVAVWEDERRLDDLEPDQREEFLRELVPPGIADLFFFDGEQIRTLAEEDEGNLLLADTVKALLGLNMVEQLEKDLDVYISRQQASDETQELQGRLRELRAEVDNYAQQISRLEARQQDLLDDIAQVNELIDHQDQRIAAEGGWFARQREEMQSKLQRLEAEIEVLQRQAQEMCGELLPFAIVPEMLDAVNERLERERSYHAWKNNESLLTKQLEQLHAEMGETDFWAGEEAIDRQRREALYERIEQSLRRTLPTKPLEEDEVFLHVSEKKQQTLQHWIEQARDAVPRSFCALIEDLNGAQTERNYVRAELEKVPAEETLAPLVSRLNELNRQVGALQKERDRLEEEIDRLNYHREVAESQLRKVRERVAEQESDDQRVQQAARTQLVLEAYKARLTKTKLVHLQEAIVKRFNQLCSKRQLINSASIDPQHYTATLYRSGEAFRRAELSAGERQLMAIATMWALREVSGRPTPVIIDTPLSRLDSAHRLSIVEDYLPNVSHQVIVLATDAEIDEQLRGILEPAISHVYYLDYDADRGATRTEMEEVAFSGNGKALINLDRIPVR